MSGRQTAVRSDRLRLAVFVSPHGFGHAARASAVLAALTAREPRLAVTLYTAVPRWFFAESLPAGCEFAYRELVCDVGLVQRSAVEEDLPATVERLERFWTEAKRFHLGDLVSELRESRADAVLCDIAPLGLLAARETGLPSILLENFTWDWIYEPLVADEPRLAPWVERMRELSALADLRIQAEPACAPLASGPAVVRVPPIARVPRATPAAVRERLGVAPGRPLILVSMGGVGWRFADFDPWHEASDFDFVVPGGAPDGTSETRRGNLVLLPHHSPVHHPDLAAAADVVVGKLGYSTVAEAHAAGARCLFPPRAGFREHAVLAEFVRRSLPCAEIDREALDSGAWVERLPALLARERPAATPSAGAAAAAAVLAERWS